MKLGEVINFRTGKLNSNAAVPNGKYPFFTCAPEPLTIDTFSFDEDCVLLAGNNANGDFNIKRYIGKFNAYQRTYIITAKDGTSIDYLFYALKFALDKFKQMSQGTATKFLTAEILKNFEIDIPSFEIQYAIAVILSAFDDKIANNSKLNHHLTPSRSVTDNSPDIRRGKIESRIAVRLLLSLLFAWICLKCAPTTSS
jgi:type I restriction enzyme, S subunit